MSRAIKLKLCEYGLSNTHLNPIQTQWLGKKGRKSPHESVILFQERPMVA